MPTTAPERCFARGLRSLENGHVLEALAHFEASLRLEERSPEPARRARYASYFGYCLAAARGRVSEGLKLCRKAAASHFFTPEILLNLARVQVMAGERREAWATLMKALRLDPQHEGVVGELKRMGVRRRPVIPFLERSHPLNKAAGIFASKGGGRKRVRPAAPARQKKKKTTSWWS